MVGLFFISQMGRPESTHLAEESGVAGAGPKHVGTAEHLHTGCGRRPRGGSPEDTEILQDGFGFSATCRRGAAWEGGGSL